MDISLNSVDDATLEYMVNVAQYEKYLRKNNILYDTGFKRDLKLYKKRIISITKRGIKDDISDVALVNTFNTYMKACISFLKLEDKNKNQHTISTDNAPVAPDAPDAPDALHVVKLTDEYAEEMKHINTMHEVKKLTLDININKQKSK